ncbi:MAG: DUF421 domain-containing protein [Clostridiales bacterium]|nr:DUF421 domain-containing protein [Clostridiales bacterium]
MLIVFIKSFIIFVIVLIAVRLMGKRTLSEMQPFELVITLVISEVACIPINDPYIPFYSGIIPIITLCFLQVVLSFISRKSLWARRMMSGKAMIVIDKNGINFDNLQKMNMNVHDLVETVHSSGYMDINEIEYAIIETNGKMSVVERMTDPTKPTPALLPLILIVDGKWNNDNLRRAGTTEAAVNVVLRKNGLKSVKDVLYADVRQDGMMYVSPKKSKYFTAKVGISKGGSW